VELYFHSPIRSHGVVLSLSIEYLHGVLLDLAEKNFTFTLCNGVSLANYTTDGEIT
jgi:hypothetical protein